MRLRLLDEVRAACKTVAECATHVKINYDRIPSYAAALPLEEARRPGHDPRSHYLRRGEDTAAFFLTLDSINFGSGYFPHLKKRPGKSGYFTVASCLNDRFKRQGPLSAAELTRLTARDCTVMFEQAPDNRPIGELMRLFAKALNDLGGYVQQDFSGSFTGLIETAGASAEGLMQLLIRMPYFYDVELYESLEVPFYKRAQLTAADLSLAFGGSGPGKFDDLKNLTIFADNLVPHVLRIDKMLLYSEQLSARIDSEHLIPAGSAEEIEIRSCALHAVELLRAELQACGHQVTSMGLDFLLWNRGQQPAYKAFPRHRTRSVFY
jgi:hypothetical protein